MQASYCTNCICGLRREVDNGKDTPRFHKISSNLNAVKGRSQVRHASNRKCNHKCNPLKHCVGHTDASDIKTRTPSTTHATPSTMRSHFALDLGRYDEDEADCVECMPTTIGELVDASTLDQVLHSLFLNDTFYSH